MLAWARPSNCCSLSWVEAVAACQLALEVQSDGRESVLYELRPHRISLGEVSSDTLVRAIRAVPTWDAKT